LTPEQRDAELQNQFVDGLRLTELQEHLRLQYADLGFDETVKKARYYAEIKDAFKPSTVDLEPMMNCLRNIQGRIEKTERGRQPER